ncbi:MAG: 4-hydroxy-tetrahydrodipicolinate reductase [Lachnospiraceae bacterium]|nr:4-hydroxy-tetrahydrodipicolinate reductase [Lachnospiraceae bacterium]
MTKIILSGCSGRMGQVVTDLAADDKDLEISWGVDVAEGREKAYPVYRSFEELAENVPDADAFKDAVIVDFSSPKVFASMMDFALSHHVNAVICTTGLSGEQIEAIEKNSAQIALLRSANMSVGVNLLMKVLRENAPTLAAAGFDIEVVEAHHNKKKDAPSGTALALADSINSAMDEKYEYVYDRTGRFEERRKGEIGISAIRGGSIVGDHQVIFAGTDEVVTFSHTAYSRAIFAKGALAAAKYLKGKQNGLYNMSHVIEG